MVQVLQAKEVGLDDLSREFQLEWVQEASFFPEWCDDRLPNLTAQEQHQLDQIKAGYLNHLKYPPLLEKTIQMIVVAPLLFLAGLYVPPFHIRAEKSIEISLEDEGTVMRGSLDILLVRDGFWVMVIESKRASFSTEAGLAQMLAYMLANPDRDRPTYGLIASGSDFLFVKLMQDEPYPKYATSDQFAMRRSGDIYEVFRILKRLTTMSESI
ncbi:MAG: restriction endonuclease subunit R [Synechococcales bacterium]|nr:restriction endonuclease subunit R [Synechococcales bacterium]